MNAPFYVPSMIRSRNQHVAVIFPTSGTVDVYRDGTRIASGQVCLETAVDSAFRTQIKRAQEKTTDQQTARAFVADAHVEGDGTFHLLTASPDRAGRYQVLSSAPSGKLIESAAFTLPYPPTQGRLEFLRNQHDMVLLSWDDRLIHVAISPTNRSTAINGVARGDQ